MPDKPLPAYEGDGPFVFVSYAHADKAQVYPEIRWLQDQGLNVWYDEGIGGASRWRDAIASRLGACRLMLFYVSGASVASQVCREELEFVLDLHKPILPVHLEATDIPDGVRLAISNRQALFRDQLGPDDYARKLVDALATNLDAELVATGSAPIPWGKHRRLSLANAIGLVVVASLLAALATYGVIDNRRASIPASPGAADLVRFSIPLREQHNLNFGDCYNAEGPRFQGRYPTTALAFSNDGTMLLFAARDLATDTQQLYLRRLDSDEIRPLAGTEGGYGARFTTDDRWISFFDGQYLRRLPVAGGEAEIIVEAPRRGCQYISPAWADETTQYLSAGNALARIDTSGKVVEGLASDESTSNNGRYLGLHALPGGNTILIHQIPSDDDPARAAIFAVNPESGERVRLLEDAMHPIYLARTGHLLFLRRGTLMAAPFNPDSLSLGGEPFVVQTGIMQAVGMHNSRFETGEGQLALSKAGHLAYLPRNVESWFPTRVLRVARDGTAEPFGSLGEREWGQLRISPSGDRLLLATKKAGERGYTTSVYDIRRDVTQTLSTGGYRDHWFAWSPDSSAIAYSSGPGGTVPNVHTLRLDEDATPRRVTPSTEPQVVADWASDGSIVFLQSGDIWRLPPAGDAHALFTSDAIEAYAGVSPDGAWLAYSNHDTEVYVRPFPGPGSATLISDNGDAPAWSHDGTQLYYLTPWQEDRVRQMMVVDVQSGTPSPARRLMDWPYDFFVPQSQYDVLPDGSFVAATAPVFDEPYRAEHIEVVLNLATLLERRGYPPRDED